MFLYRLLGSALIALLLLSFQAKAQSIPPAAEWSASNVIVVNRNSPDPAMAVVDINNGVLLSYDAPTGGINVGTSTRQYDFVTSAASAGTLSFDLAVNSINGTFANSLLLEILRNGIVVSTLDSTSANTYSADFVDQSLALSAGDTWGIRATAGNFSLSTGTSAEISVTSQIIQTRYDVADDWSDAQNPNGVWTYTGDNGVLLTFNQENWDPGHVFFSGPQRAWADAMLADSGHVPMWLRAAQPSSLDLTGVGMHGSEGGNTAWVGVIWTSPAGGTVNIGGGVWHAFKAVDPFGGDHRLRNSDWRLRLNQTVLASGNVSGTDGFSSAAPFTFAAGSGGAPLSDIAVTAGDELVLEFISPTSFATFIGLDFAVTLEQPVPETSPRCEIELNQASFVDGEALNLDQFRLANLSAAPLALELKTWLGLPDGSSLSVFNLGADGSFVVPSGWDIDLGPAPLLSVSAALPRGSYEFSCRMLDPVTGELLVQDRNFFVIE